MTILSERRAFIKQTAVSGLGLGILGANAPMVFGKGSAAEKIVVGIMGTNNRGSALAKGFARLPGSEVGYICDVDEKALAKGIKAVQEAGQKKKPKAVKDFREILDKKDLDVLVIAAPGHWHAPAAILALNAGKHVYVEKPCSHNPREGELLVEAAIKYKKVVQMGNQRRSWPNVIEGIEQVKGGAIGDVHFAKAWYANTRGSIGKGKVAAVPSGLDYDLWQGPAPRREYRDNVIHYNWHWFWHWGTGEITNNGTHFIDLCRWGLQVDYPVRVSSMGGRYTFQDDWETPDTQITTYDFADQKTITWEGRSCNGRDINGISAGASFHGDKGTLTIDGNGYTIFDNKDKTIKEVRANTSDALDTTGPGMKLDMVHLKDFTDAIRNGGKPHSDIEDANKSVHLCHLGNIAHRVKRTLTCQASSGKILGDDEAMTLWGRQYEPGWEPQV